MESRGERGQPATRLGMVSIRKRRPHAPTKVVSQVDLLECPESGFGAPQPADMITPIFAGYGGCYGRDCGPTLPWWVAVLIVGAVIVMIVLIVRAKSRTQSGTRPAPGVSARSVDGPTISTDPAEKTVEPPSLERPHDT